MRYDPPAAVKTLLNDAAINAHLAARDANRPMPPVPLRTVAFGQPFVIDNTPGLLFARMRGAPPNSDIVPAVVIACMPDEAHASDALGSVYALQASDTVRPVDITRPAQVTVR